MKISTAYLITEYSEEEKKLLQKVGAIYSLPVKGWFITEEQKVLFETYKSNPESIPAPSIQAKDTAIYIDDMGDSWKISGDTFSKKDKIKELGGRWNVSDKSWRIPREKHDKQTILAKLG